MSFSFVCPRCGKHLQVLDSAAGRKARCPQCGHVIRVPRPDPAEEAPIAPESPEGASSPPNAAPSARWLNPRILITAAVVLVAVVVGVVWVRGLREGPPTGPQYDPVGPRWGRQPGPEPPDAGASGAGTPEGAIALRRAMAYLASGPDPASLAARLANESENGHAEAARVLRDAQGINALFDGMEVGWSTRNAPAVADNCNERLVLVADPPGRAEGALVLDRAGFAALLTRYFAGGKSPRAHDIVQRHIVPMGNIALAATRAVDSFADGPDVTSQSLIITQREGADWRVLFGFPLIAEAVVQVTQILPDGQAAALGVEPGDRVLAYGDEPIMSAAQLADAIARPGGQEAGAQVQLKTQRGGKERVFQVQPGALGLDPATLLMPIEGAEFLAASKHTELHEAAARAAEAVRARDVDAMLAEASPTAALFLTRDESGRTVRASGLATAREEVERHWEWQAENSFVPESLQCTGIGGIVKGNLALVVYRFSYQSRKDGPMEASNVLAFARENGKWHLVAPVPFPDRHVGVGRSP